MSSKKNKKSFFVEKVVEPFLDGFSIFSFISIIVLAAWLIVVATGFLASVLPTVVSLIIIFCISCWVVGFVVRQVGVIIE